VDIQILVDAVKQRLVQTDSALASVVSDVVILNHLTDLYLSSKGRDFIDVAYPPSDKKSKCYFQDIASIRQYSYRYPNLRFFDCVEDNETLGPPDNALVFSYSEKPRLVLKTPEGLGGTTSRLVVDLMVVKDQITAVGDIHVVDYCVKRQTRKSVDFDWQTDTVVALDQHAYCKDRQITTSSVIATWADDLVEHLYNFKTWTAAFPEVAGCAFNEKHFNALIGLTTARVQSEISDLYCVDGSVICPVGVFDGCELLKNVRYGVALLPHVGGEYLNHTAVVEILVGDSIRLVPKSEFHVHAIIRARMSLIVHRFRNTY